MEYAEQYWEQVAGPVYTLPELNVTPDWGLPIVREKGRTLEDILGRDLRPSPEEEEFAKQHDTYTGALAGNLIMIAVVIIGTLLVFKLVD